jgi:CheY-like chemotaxis protein
MMTENPPLILVVEDNPDNRTLIRDVLDALNYNVIEATDGIEGVEMALSSKPSLILMDLSLPGKDGWEATREIKANASMEKVPVIALTAHAMVGDRERALEAGCDDYVSKPINLMELNEKIQRYLAKAVPTPEPSESGPGQAEAAPSASAPPVPEQVSAVQSAAELPEPAKPEAPKPE